MTVLWIRSFCCLLCIRVTISIIIRISDIWITISICISKYSDFYCLCNLRAVWILNYNRNFKLTLFFCTTPICYIWCTAYCLCTCIISYSAWQLTVINGNSCARSPRCYNYIRNCCFIINRLNRICNCSLSNRCYHTCRY